MDAYLRGHGVRGEDIHVRAAVLVTLGFSAAEDRRHAHVVLDRAIAFHRGACALADARERPGGSGVRGRLGLAHCPALLNPQCRSGRRLNAAAGPGFTECDILRSSTQT